MKGTARLSVVLGLVGACATGGAGNGAGQPGGLDAPEPSRPGYGNTELHTWWPLTPPELAALHDLPAARRGDAHALLALAIVASGDHRDAASHASYHQRVDQFVASMRSSVSGAADEWHRGYEVHRAMHRSFFGGFTADKDELKGYDFYQGRITGTFASGTYNCLSSALMFTVLARAFGLPVRAAVVPTHVFVELGEPGGKVIEIETTSSTGFDWIHDERFYRQSAAAWSARRGLRPTTVEEYRARRILAPYQLMALGMRDGHRAGGEQDQHRLDELAGVVDPDDPAAQQARLRVYVNEGHDLFDAKAWPTMVRLFDTVHPAIDEIAAKTQDGQARELASWANWYHAHALMMVGRPDEGIAVMGRGLEHLEPTWSDAVTLRNNYVAVLVNRLGELVQHKDYATAARTFTTYRDQCLLRPECAMNASVIFQNWSIEHQNAGDWQAARQVLRDCVSQLPGDRACGEALVDLESRHRF